MFNIEIITTRYMLNQLSPPKNWMLTSKPPLQPSNALLAGRGIFHCKATTENVFDKIPLNPEYSKLFTTDDA